MLTNRPQRQEPAKPRPRTGHGAASVIPHLQENEPVGNAEPGDDQQEDAEAKRDASRGNRPSGS